MTQSIRHLARTGFAVAAAAALSVSAVGVASAQEDAYPEPTVSAQVDGNNIITTVTDNGGGENNGEAVFCSAMGMEALDALPLAEMEPEDLDLAQILPMFVWGDLNNSTTSDNPEVINEANESLQDPELDELPAGTYASIGVCLSPDDEVGFAIHSMAYDAPIFVPGGVGSIGQALDLGSSALSLDGGSAMLMNFGSEMVGS